VIQSVGLREKSWQVGIFRGKLEKISFQDFTPTDCSPNNAEECDLCYPSVIVWLEISSTVTLTDAIIFHIPGPLVERF